MNDTLDDLVKYYTFDGKLRNFYRVNANHIGDLFLEKLSQTNDVNDFAILCTLILDLRINSDLTEEEKEEYELGLGQSIFFREFSNYLTSDRLWKRTNVISTFGRLSNPENARYLEKAFENTYYESDPISAARSIFELSWLHSDKVISYLKLLQNTNDPINMLALGMYYASSGREANYISLRTNYAALDSIENLEEYFQNYEIVVQNMHNINGIGVWSKSEYLASIHFYNHIRNQVGEPGIDYRKLYEDFLLVSRLKSNY